MKLKNIALYLLATGLLSTSCLNEDYSDCHNVYALELSYLGDGTTEIFPQKIDQVQMYVFDESNACVSSKLLSNAEVSAQKVVLPPLDEGDYRIVCIGNNYQTKVENLTSGDYQQIRFADEGYLAGEQVSGNDPLYYASMIYNIAPYDPMNTVETSRTIYFESSHYDVTVDVVGIAPITKAYGYPVIELVGVSPYTDFENNAFGSATTYRMEATHDGTYTLKGANNIMRHSNHEDVYLRVSTYDGTSLAQVNFAEWLELYKDEIDCTKNEVIIPFEIVFSSGSVQINLPYWYVEYIKPIF